MDQEVVVQGLILGADGSHEDLVQPGNRECHLPMLRIRPDRQRMARRGARGSDPHARVERHHPGLVRQQGIDIELANLRVRDDEQADAHEDHRDQIEVGRRAVAVALEQPIGASAASDRGRA